MWKQLSTAAFSPLLLVYPGRTQAISNIFVGPSEVSPLVRDKYFMPHSIKKEVCEVEFISAHTSSEKRLFEIWEDPCPFFSLMSLVCTIRLTEVSQWFCCLSCLGMGDLGLTSGCSGQYIHNEFPQLW